MVSVGLALNKYRCEYSTLNSMFTKNRIKSYLKASPNRLSDYRGRRGGGKNGPF